MAIWWFSGERPPQVEPRRRQMGSAPAFVQNASPPTVQEPVLRTIVGQIATARVTEVDDGSATATLSGTAAVQVGDQVKSAP